MLIEKKCLICGKSFNVPHWREHTAKYCSVVCQNKSLHAKPNLICPCCGKAFHRKATHIKRHKGKQGFYCSRECGKYGMRLRMSGEGNHQYGLKGNKNASFKGDVLLERNHNLIERRVYAPHRVDADKNGRVTEHRLLVQENWQMFPPEAFDVIEGQHVLKKGFAVHHIDHNHNNNALENLMVLTKSEHFKHHQRNYYSLRSRRTGRVVKRIPFANDIEWVEVDELTEGRPYMLAEGGFFEM